MRLSRLAELLGVSVRRRQDGEQGYPRPRRRGPDARREEDAGSCWRGREGWGNVGVVPLIDLR